jgi:hypothetical protein
MLISIDNKVISTSCLCYFGEIVLNLLEQKVTQNVAISMGYLIFKNHNELPNVAQLVKNRPIWSPWSEFGQFFEFVKFNVSTLGLFSRPTLPIQGVSKDSTA